MFARTVHNDAHAAGRRVLGRVRQSSHSPGASRAAGTGPRLRRGGDRLARAGRDGPGAAAGDARGAGGGPRSRPHRAHRGNRGPRRDARSRHVHLAGVVRPGPPRGRGGAGRRRPRDGGPRTGAGARAAAGASRRARAGDGVLPVQQRRGGRRLRPREGRVARRRGRHRRPPRQRHPADLRGRPVRPLRLDPPVPVLPGHRRGDRGRLRHRPGTHRQRAHRARRRRRRLRPRAGAGGRADPDGLRRGPHDPVGRATTRTSRIRWRRCRSRPTATARCWRRCAPPPTPRRADASWSSPRAATTCRRWARAWTRRSRCWPPRRRRTGAAARRAPAGPGIRGREAAEAALAVQRPFWPLPI